MKIKPLLLLAAVVCPVFGQTSPTLAGAGYSSPAPVEVAPGQVITLFLRGVPPAANGQLRSGEASDAPLSATLAGISVTIAQAQAALLPVPIFAVRQESACAPFGATDPACLLTSIKVQIPFELAAEQNGLAPVAQLSVAIDGRAGRSFPLQPLPENAHAITTCDLSWDTNAASVCNRQVYHADGTVAGENAPAHPGETVSVYFYGLGAAGVGVATGMPAPPGAVLVEGSLRIEARIQTDFVNALSSTPRVALAAPPDSPVLAISAAGFVRGQVGVYQVNFTLPSSLPTVLPCGDGVHSNTLVSIRSSLGQEGIGLCVQP